MPKIVEPFSQDSEAQRLLAFANGAGSGCQIDRRQEEELRQHVRGFLLGMLRLGELPARQISLVVNDTKLWRWVCFCASARSSMSSLGRQVDAEFWGLVNRCRIASDELLQEVLRRSNRPGIGFCRVCASYFAMDLKRKKPRQSCSTEHYNVLYQREHRDLEASARSKKRGRRRARTSTLQDPDLHPGDRSLLKDLLGNKIISKGQMPMMVKAMIKRRKEKELPSPREDYKTARLFLTGQD